MSKTEMTPSDKLLRELCAKATPGPWHPETPNPNRWHFVVCDSREFVANTDNSEANQEFIAAANPAAVQRRAEMLAKLMGVELDVDLTWPCIASRKMACRCPKCIEEGRA